MANKSRGIPRTAERLDFEREGRIENERKSKAVREVRLRREEEEEETTEGKGSHRCRRLHGRRDMLIEKRRPLSARAQGQVHGAPSSRLKEPKWKRCGWRYADDRAGSGALPA